MERLTDRRTAAELKANGERLRELGFEPSILDKRYIKLAEYEDREERERNEAKHMKDKIKYEKPKLYYCDPTKRPQCKPIACYLNGGCCELTEHKEFARTDENGKYMEYKEGDL